MSLKIEFKGNSYTNKSSRDGIKPDVIVDHITSSAGSSAHYWFTSPNNNVSSAHFIVWEDGRVTQYVDIREMAWANGLKADAIGKAKSSLVRSRSSNPNKYSISIEHVGHSGALTDAQLKSTILLHKHIIAEVKRIYGVTIPANRTHILGHYEIDPIRKPSCPGSKFPWDAIISGLKGKAVSSSKPSSSKPAKQPTSTNSTVLRPNNKTKSSAVVKLQKDLIALGYNLSKYGADGFYGAVGKETESAVRTFQKEHGLSVDGLAGPKTLSAVAKALTEQKKAGYKLLSAKSGSKGEITAYQKLLIKAGYKLPKYGADGFYGDETVQATRRFQKDHGLDVDGLAGVKTQTRLNAVA